MSNEFPVEGVELTLLLVVEDVERARSFYVDVLGAALFREYGGTSAVIEFQGAWILLVTGGEPTGGCRTTRAHRTRTTGPTGCRGQYLERGSSHDEDAAASTMLLKRPLFGFQGPGTALVPVVLAGAWLQPAFAQEVGRDASTSGARRNSDILVHATYVENRPSIDGVLDELFWRTIEPISGFKQRVPNEGAEPTERSEVRIAYDERALYFGLTLFDSEPDKIRRTVMKREGLIPQDDHVHIGLDSYNDDRNAYLFELNSFGTQGDALVTDESDIAWNWEGVYESQGQVNDEGWVLEVAIPFTTIRFDPAEPIEMGVVIERGIVRKNEIVMWPLIDLDYKRFWGLPHSSQYATIVGLENVRPGRNLEIKPYGLAGAQKVNLGVEGVENDTDTDFGLDEKRATGRQG